MELTPPLKFAVDEPFSQSDGLLRMVARFLPVASVGPLRQTAPVSSLQAGDVVRGKFLIESEIGSGGMGTVYQAIHMRMKTRVALKLLDKDRAAQPANVSRFEREAFAVARLRGSYTVRVYDVDVLDSGVPFLVMQLLRGRDLGRVLKQTSPTIQAIADWTIQICSAIYEAHQLGIVHRDLKPSNIFVLDRDNRIKIVDFGISKLRDGVDITADSEVLGTPKYMSPEQLRGEPVGPQSDLWSIGIILYQMLAHTHPFPTSERGAPFVAAAATLTQQPVPLQAYRPDLPEALCAAVMGCLEKSLDRRCPTARELASKLAPFASGSVVFEEIPAGDYEREPMPSLSAFSTPLIDDQARVEVEWTESVSAEAPGSEGRSHAGETVVEGSQRVSRPLPTGTPVAPAVPRSTRVSGARGDARRPRLGAWIAAAVLVTAAALGAGLAPRWIANELPGEAAAVPSAIVANPAPNERDAGEDAADTEVAEVPRGTVTIPAETAPPTNATGAGKPQQSAPPASPKPPAGRKDDIPLFL